MLESNFLFGFMTTIIIWTVAVITGLGLLLALALYIVAQRFKVEEDPRIVGHYPDRDPVLSYRNDRSFV